MSNLILYHGTCLSRLPSIAKNGILPRGRNRSNWKGIVKSHPDYAYLTSCYACYYATSASKRDGDSPVVLKVDATGLDIYPDEDFLFFLYKQNSPGSETKMKRDPGHVPFLIKDESTGEYRQVGGRDSLRILGTVAVRGVPPERILGCATEGRKLDFIMNCDPVISPVNFRFCSDGYINYLESLEFKPISSLVSNEAA